MNMNNESTIANKLLAQQVEELRKENTRLNEENSMLKKKNARNVLRFRLIRQYLRTLRTSYDQYYSSTEIAVCDANQRVENVLNKILSSELDPKLRNKTNLGRMFYKWEKN